MAKHAGRVVDVAMSGKYPMLVGTLHQLFAFEPNKIKANTDQLVTMMASGDMMVSSGAAVVVADIAKAEPKLLLPHVQVLRSQISGGGQSNSIMAWQAL